MKVYKGDNTSGSSNMLCNIDGNKVYKGDNTSGSNNMLCNLSETRFSNEQFAAILIALGLI